MQREANEMKWTNVPDEPGTWFKYYRGSFQTYEYFVKGPRGLEYSRIQGVLVDHAIDGMRWLGPIPPDPESDQVFSKRDVK